MTITLGEFYILQILNKKSSTITEISNQIQLVREPIFSTKTNMIYHHLSILSKGELVEITKSRAIPQIITASLTEKGKNILKTYEDFISLGKKDEKVSPRSKVTQPQIRRDIDLVSLRESLELTVITDLLKKELEDVTEDERARIQPFIDKVLKIIEKNV
jgi:DNA-binding PadR family transcriptional regulator